MLSNCQPGPPPKSHEAEISKWSDWGVFRILFCITYYEHRMVYSKLFPNFTSEITCKYTRSISIVVKLPSIMLFLFNPKDLILLGMLLILSPSCSKIAWMRKIFENAFIDILTWWHSSNSALLLDLKRPNTLFSMGNWL